MGRINDIGELPEEKAFMNEFWAFRKQYYNGRDEPDEWWESLVDEVNRLEEKYGKKYYRDVLVACVSDIERRAGSGRRDMP